MEYQAIIIGSGPAGLSAALALAERGIHPLILERMDRPSLKLLASGGGRCNFSNQLPPEKFMEKFGRNGAFMRQALRCAPREWLIRFLQECGIKAELTDDFYWFPASGKAADIRDAFMNHSQAEIRTESEVTALTVTDGMISGVELKNGSRLSAPCVILAAGGCAWAGLGTHAGLKLAVSTGHTIRKPLPAVAPLLIREEWIGSLAGVTLTNAALSLHSGRNVIKTHGSLLFTHTGFSGFPAMDLASEAAALCDKNGSTPILFTVCNDKTSSDWRRILENARQQTGQKMCAALLAEYMPRSVAVQFTDLCGCSNTKLASLAAESREKILRILNEYPLTLTGAGPLDKAMAMRGGVSLKEVNPDTLESKLVRGLFFAGEILDLVGPCGGYNMQWAFSGGRLAGLSAGNFLSGGK